MRPSSRHRWSTQRVDRVRSGFEREIGRVRKGRLERRDPEGKGEARGRATPHVQDDEVWRTAGVRTR